MRRVLYEVCGQKYVEMVDDTNNIDDGLGYLSRAYIETPNGYFKCLKNPSDPRMPLTPEEAIIWILSAVHRN